VKTNVGHLEAAAGIAGLIKAVLALQHEEIPPNLHLRNPSPHIPWDEMRITVPTSPIPWPDSRRRLAGVSSFGLSGMNAHVVLERAPRPEQPARVEEVEEGQRCYLLPLSARSPE